MLATASAALLVSILIVFHAVLLWQRVLDLSLFEPVPAIRWLATAVLSAGVYRLHRRGVSLIRGRSALVFWLLVLLLHASFWGPSVESASTLSELSETGLLLALPAISIVLGVFTPSIRRLLARMLRSPILPDLSGTGETSDSQSFELLAGLLPVVSSRPPPAFSH